MISTLPPDFNQKPYADANIPRGCCLACQNPVFGTVKTRPSSEKHQPSHRVSTSGVSSLCMGRGRAERKAGVWGGDSAPASPLLLPRCSRSQETGFTLKTWRFCLFLDALRNFSSSWTHLSWPELHRSFHGIVAGIFREKCIGMNTLCHRIKFKKTLRAHSLGVGKHQEWKAKTLRVCEHCKRSNMHIRGEGQFTHRE